MKPWRQSIVTFFAVASSATLSGCDSCDNEIQDEVYNSDRTLRAVVFMRDCGATVGDNTQVSVLPTADTLPGGPGNAFIEDRNHVDSVDLKVKVAWKAANVLSIKCDPNAHILLQKHD